MRFRLAIPFAVALASLVGCAAQSGEEADDAEVSEDALTESERDERRIAKIREKVGNVDEEHVVLDRRYKAPTRSASSGARLGGASLYGVDWFQKWPGGLSADHGWDNGTEAGKRCMWAAVLRFEAIMKEPPEELTAFLAEYSRWGGSFYNWVDDYSKPESYGDASGARLWAWRTGLSKWISAAAKDGSCYLPTKQMLVNYAQACNRHQASNAGEMQGCQASR
ncbi:MAG: hypothetical protein KF819_33060 [Labilithrix sp.]|nr:hypothetical protein [Labilithrix sp.]